MKNWKDPSQKIFIMNDFILVFKKKFQVRKETPYRFPLKSVLKSLFHSNIVFIQDNYDKTFLKEIYTYPVVTYDELRRELIKRDGPVRIQYNTREQYKRTAKMLGLMDDLKVKQLFLNLKYF